VRRSVSFLSNSLFLCPSLYHVSFNFQESVFAQLLNRRDVLRSIPHQIYYTPNLEVLTTNFHCHLPWCYLRCPLHRLLQLHTVRYPAELDLMSTNSKPVIAEGCGPEPIADNVFTCILTDISAISSNTSVLLDNIERSGGNRNNAQCQAGLAIVCDFMEASLFSEVSHGNLYMVSNNLSIRAVCPMSRPRSNNLPNCATIVAFIWTCVVLLAPHF